MSEPQKGEHPYAFRLAIVFLLAMIEVMPVYLLSQAVPVMMRQRGASVTKISFVYFSLIPWALEFMWAPIVDRFGVVRLGRYRSWLLIMHPVVMVYLVLLANLDFAGLLTDHAGLAYALIFGLTTLCAITDIASNALSTLLLSPAERGVGNGVQTAGIMTGHVVGGGGMLLLMEQLGWHDAMLIVAATFVLPFASVVFCRETSMARTKVSMRALADIFYRPRIARWLLALSLIVLASSLMYTPLQVLLVDRGLSIGEVGIAMGLFGSAAGALGGLIGGKLTERFGRGPALYTTGMVGALLMTPLIVCALYPVPKSMLYAASACSYGGMMAQYAVLYTLMMDRSRPDMPGTDYSVQYSLLQLMGFVSMALGGVIADTWGASTCFIVTPIAMLLALLASRILMASTEINLVDKDLQGLATQPQR